MKRWAVLTVMLYVLVLVALTVPVILICFGDWWLGKDRGVGWEEAVPAYQELGYWLWLALMACGQALLLFAPVGIAERRLTPRRPLLVPVITASFFLANLFLGGMLSALCILFKDKALDLFAVFGELAWTDGAHNLIGTQLLKTSIGPGPATLDYILGIVTVMTTLWLVWAMVFYLFARGDDPNSLVKRTTRWLLRGSILELLVAVPSHIIVRNRNDCCAPLGTFWGITTGISIMLLCFGPGVFFLFSERFGRLRRK
jgi:hypothetical protein